MYNRIVLRSLSLLALCTIAQEAFAVNIAQVDIPYVISAPGDYFLTEDVTFAGPGNAITIAASQVQLYMQDFEITLSGNEVVGIRVLDEVNPTDIEIYDGNIINTTEGTNRGAGIHASGIHNLYLAGINTWHNRNGLFIKKCHDVEVINCHFTDATKYGTLVKESKAVFFDGCDFKNGKHGLKFKTDNKECYVINCSFPSAELANLLVEQMQDLTIENCSFNNQSRHQHKKAIVQFGSGHAHRVPYNVIMRNCTIINRAHGCVSTSPEGIGIYRGSGFLIESCVIDISNAGQSAASDLSGIHISNPDLGSHGAIATDVIIRDCIIQGFPINGIYPDTGSDNILMDNNLVSGASKDGIFLAGTSACTVSNNTVVNNGTNGIFVGEASSNNAIINNVINSNGFNAIVTSLPPFGNGISIALDSTFNLVQGNFVFNNATNGINDQGVNNRIFSNVAYANTVNYVSATDTIVVSVPGSPALTAANIDG